MNPFKDILDKLQTTYKEVRARCDAALSGMGPIDQIEASQPVRCLLGDFRWSMDRLKDMGDQVETSLASLEENSEAIAQAHVVAEIEAGNLITKDAMQLVIASAEKTERTKVEGEFTALAEKATLVATRRAEVVTAHGEAAAKVLTDDDLAADDYQARVTILATRVKSLTEAGITAERSEDAYVSILSKTFDEAGDAAFTGSLNSIVALAGGPAPAGTPTPAGEAAAKASRGDVPAGTPAAPQGGTPAPAEAEAPFVL